ncbi:polyprenyl synthetase family protein [bacterium]|nr:polyprenyl synthetase family protein [candidate division CSSED10-310 bacterium]
MLASNTSPVLPCRSIQSELDLFEVELFDCLNIKQNNIRNIILPTIKSGGKRIRPALVFLSAYSTGSHPEKHQRYAVVVELIHTASLFHDDVIDEAKHRRGNKSVNQTFGNQLAVLAGDYLYSKAIDLMSAESLAIRNSLNKTVLTMTEGEIVQSANRHNVKATPDLYMRVIEKKTAILMELSCCLGASAHDQPKYVEALKDYGKNLGIAYQLLDDLLDWYAEEKKLGKDNFQDLKEGRVTLPAILLLKNLKGRDKQKFTDLIEADSLEMTIDMQKYYRQLLIDFRIDSKIRRMANQFSQKAIESIKNLPKTDALEELKSIPQFLMNRIG